MKNIPIGVKVTIAILAILIGVGVFSGLGNYFSDRIGTQTYGGSLTVADRNSEDAFGTADSFATMNQTYSSSTALRALGLSNVVIAGNYIPKSYGSRLYLVLERSVDNGATYQNYGTLTPETGDVLVNTNGTSTTGGTPFVIPGNAIGSAASGTSIGFSYDLSIAADYIRIAAKEYSTSTSGTAHIILFASNN